MSRFLMQLLIPKKSQEGNEFATKLSAEVFSLVLSKIL